METRDSAPEKVNTFMQKLSHPLKPVIESLRKIILETDKSIGEEIKWNAPTFFYTGPMKPSNPKEYKRYLVVSNVRPMEHIMLVLPHGADIDDGSGFLEGDYTDGRRLLMFTNLKDVEKNKKKLQKVVKDLLKKVTD